MNTKLIVAAFLLGLMSLTARAIETPTGIYFDEVASDRIVASAYAPVFTGLSGPVAGINIAKNGVYSGWHVNGDSWVTKASIPTARSLFAVGVVGGKIYVLGGYDSNSALNKNEEYDPVSNTWAIRASMPTARFNFAIGVIAGKIYAVGGNPNTNANEEYNPETNSWLIKAAMPTARRSLSAGVVGGRMYVVGGAGDEALMNANEEYDPVTNLWVTKAPMPTGRHSLAVGVINGKLYAIGGVDGSLWNKNEEYSPVSNTWLSRAVLPWGGAYIASGVLGGRLFVVVCNSSGRVYDPVTDDFYGVAMWPACQGNLVAAVAGGRLYALGASNQEYDPGVASIFTGLTPNTLYSFKAKARDSAGIETSESPIISTYTLAATPTAAAPVFSNVSATGFTLNWLANGNLPGALYRAQISTMATFVPSISSDTINLHAGFAGLIAGATYYARVAAQNSGGVWTGYSTLSSPGLTITSISPASGLLNADTPVTILGAGFSPGATVKLKKSGRGEMVSASVTYVSDTQIACTLLTSTMTTIDGYLAWSMSGAWDVEVAKTDGNSVRLESGFVLSVPSPTITAVNPSSGFRNAVVNLTISGSDFWTGCSMWDMVSLTRPGQPDISSHYFGGGAVSTSQINWSLPIAGVLPGTWNVVVKNCDGQTDTLLNGFTIEAGASTTTVTPNHGFNNLLLRINIAGGDFASGIAVALKKTGQTDISCANIVVVSSAQLACDIPITGATPGAWDVVITYPNAQLLILPGAFTVHAVGEINKQAGNLKLANNVFNPKTGGAVTLLYTLKKPGHLKIKVCDLRGRLVKEIIDTSSPAGVAQAQWNGHDKDGLIVPPGIYLVYFESPDGTEVRKVAVKR